MFYVSAVEYVTFHVLMHMEYALFMLGQRTASGNGKLKIVDEEGEGGRSMRTHEGGHLEAVEALLGEHAYRRGDVDVRRRQVAGHPRQRRHAVPPAQGHRIARPSAL